MAAVPSPRREIPARPRGRALLALLLAALLVAAGVPNDPLAPQQHHLEIVRAFEAWDVRRGEGAVVAVLDTGVDLAHPDLAGRLVEGIDLIDRDTPPDDPQGHGTLVAGIIAAVADNGRGVTGVAPQARIMPIRVLDAEGRGTSDVVAEGIRHAVEQGVQVINLSLAEVKADQGIVEVPLVADSEVQQAIVAAAAAGVVVVAAAGNDGRSSTPYSRTSPVIVVGASTVEDTVWEESNVDERTLFAPGVEILSTWHQARYAKASGTSFATPIVAAGAAMLTGAGLPAEEVSRRLAETAVDIGAGLGRVDLAAAVQGVAAAPTPTSTPIPPPTETEPPVVETAPSGPSGGLEPVEPVQEVLGPPPAQVTEAPPPIATIDPDTAVEQPQAPIELPAMPVASEVPVPDRVEPPPPSRLMIDDAGGVGREVLVPLATALIGVDMLLAMWVVGRRRD